MHHSQLHTYGGVTREHLSFLGVGTMFKKVVPVTKYTSLEETVTTGEMMGKKLKDILPTLLER